MHHIVNTLCSNTLKALYEILYDIYSRFHPLCTCMGCSCLCSSQPITAGRELASQNNNDY